MVRNGFLPIVAVLALAAGCSDSGGYRGGQTPTPAAPTAFPLDPKERQVECKFTDDEALYHSVAVKLARGDKDQIAGAYSDLGRRLAFLAVSPGGTQEFAEALSEWAGASADVGAYVAKTAPPKGRGIDYGPSYPRWVEAKKAAEKLCGQQLPNPQKSS
ncbi:hypothetical protein AB0M20_07095 [Actinoplanes sp. NPDC051633]|uniref:hypothetical protein n=1 Tax=Actinoplanes sp. NPDC051633 TaxID=3155670 RepID=UPI003429E943